MPILTLTSDIGIQDFMPAAIKGQIMQIDPSFTIVDVSHLLSPFNYPLAAYVCKNVINHFQKGTFHLILINLFDQKNNHLLLAEHDGYYIGCADNGLLTMILGQLPQKVVQLPIDHTKPKNIINYAIVFAKAFAAIANGQPIEALGNTNAAILEKNTLKPLLGHDWIEGQILFVDNFDNVIVNITRQEFESHRSGRNFSVVFKRDEVINKISETYADVPEGEKLVLFNTADYLEIAINKGKAASLFGLQGFSEKQQPILKVQFSNNHIFYQTVKIFFD